MNISARLGASEPSPERTQVEVAPAGLRNLLRTHIVEEYGMVPGYKWMADQVGIDSSNIFSHDWADSAFRDDMSSLPWGKVYELAEAASKHLKGQKRKTFEDRVNAVLAETGVAYELQGGAIARYDAVAREIDLEELAEGALKVLTGGLQPAGDQFRRAMKALHGRPMDGLGAVRESVNAAEATAKILAGLPKASFGEAMDALFLARRAGHERAMIAGMKQLYGYASQLPGARHGQHTTVSVTYAEAALSVNLMGSLIVYLVSEFGT